MLSIIRLRPMGRLRSAIALLMLLLSPPPIALAAGDAPLRLEATIPLGDVRGRIDHLAVDIGGQRLFVAELGNDSVGVIDLRTGSLIRRLDGFAEPQGIAYAGGTLFVANGRDGSLRLFRGSDLTATGNVAL